MGIDRDAGVNVGAFSRGQRQYLEFHRENVLRMARGVSIALSEDSIDAVTTDWSSCGSSETFAKLGRSARPKDIFLPSDAPANNLKYTYRISSNARTLCVTGCASFAPSSYSKFETSPGQLTREEDVMPERLVDIKTGERLLHTFPVTTSDQTAQAGDESFKKKALEAAAHARVVPNEELETLSARMHVSRGGPLQPNPDSLGVMAETKEGLDQVVRERAYLLWQQAGRPDGRSDEFWHQAQHQRWCERAYALWTREGCLEGKADEHWHRTLDFESGG